MFGNTVVWNVQSDDVASRNEFVEIDFLCAGGCNVVVVVINNSVQTTAGRLVFARVEGDDSELPPTTGSMLDAATTQPRHDVESPPPRDAGRKGRSPRR